ncbi:MAG: hypothetical protein ACI36Y_01905 [Coriobacteriales bacterium]
MYGIGYRIDEKALAAAGLSVEEFEERVESILSPLGYSRACEGALLCTDPSSVNELLVVHDTIVALGRCSLFAKAAESVEAFKLDACGDITAAVRDESIKLIPTQETLLAFEEGEAFLASDKPGRFDTADDLLAAALSDEGPCNCGIPAAEVYAELGIDMAEIEAMPDVELDFSDCD